MNDDDTPRDFGVEPVTDPRLRIVAEKAAHKALLGAKAKFATKLWVFTTLGAVGVLTLGAFWLLLGRSESQMAKTAEGAVVKAADIAEAKVAPLRVEVQALVQSAEKSADRTEKLTDLLLTGKIRVRRDPSVTRGDAP